MAEAFLIDDDSDAPVERLITADEFLRMIDAGVFADDDRWIELDEGRIVVSPIAGGVHGDAGRRLNMLWTPRIMASPALRARLELYIPGGLRVSSRTVRAPDALLTPPGTRTGRNWPTAPQALLAVEIADRTVNIDDKRKRAQYARGGLPELWVVRVKKQDVRVCRGPRSDGTWEEADLHSGEMPIAPLAAPELAIAPAALFES